MSSRFLFVAQVVPDVVRVRKGEVEVLRPLDCAWHEMPRYVSPPERGVGEGPERRMEGPSHRGDHAKKRVGTCPQRSWLLPS